MSSTAAIRSFAHRGLLRRVLSGTVLTHLLFWSWNGIFLLVVAAGFAPHFLGPFVRDTVAGLLPPGLALCFGAVLLVPPAAMVVGFRWRRRPSDLLRLFYGLEMPLFFLALARLFFVRQLTAPQLALVLGVGLGLLAYGSSLWRGLLRHRRLFEAWRLTGLGILLALAVWAGTLLFLYLWPLAVQLWAELFAFDWLRSLWRELWQRPWRGLVFGSSLLLFGYSASLFLAMPVVSVILYGRAWRQSLWDLSGRLGRWPARAIATIPVVVLCGLVAANSVQPQTEAFFLLSQVPSSDAERQQRLAAHEKIRAGLVNAYLAPYRYFGTAGHPRRLEREYTRAFGSDDWRPVSVAHDVLAAPWLYQGEDIHRDGGRAAELYAGFFDQPMQDKEGDEIRAALGATYDRDEIEAGLLNRDAEKVFLLSQHVRVKEHGDWAAIELHEVYQNQTFEAQEILYYFSLPESAVVTGLWLGDSDQRQRAFRFVVAPRGAAQQVYRAQVQRQVDPALIEQIGPRQYRLRAFPVLPRDRLFEEPTPRLHLWLTFRVLADRGHWPLPQLRERRNVFWSEKTERHLNGEAIPSPGDGWLWPNIAARSWHDKTAHQVQLPGGWSVRATPAPRLPRHGAPLRLAVVVDRSLSMAEQKEELLAAVRELTQQGHDIDWYLTSAPSRGEPPVVKRRVSPRDFVFYGGHATSHLLNQLAEKHQDGRYNGAIVLSDAGGYELEAETSRAPYPLEAPLWLVHLGGDLPVAYTDPVLAAIQSSGGGIAFCVDQAVSGIAAHKNNAVERWLDGYRWEIEKNGIAPKGVDPFAPLAARTAVNLLQARQGISLDDLHALAKRHEIVTPYSSMIVLVNDRQKEELRRTEESESRFDRRNESGKERLSAPSGSDMVVSGVPEPEEWALILVAVVLLAIYAWRHRRRLVVGHPGAW